VAPVIFHLCRPFSSLLLTPQFTLHGLKRKLEKEANLFKKERKGGEQPFLFFKKKTPSGPFGRNG
jgi:hypothetical protein